METSLCHNSVARHQIATNFCTCHDSTAVVPCTKFCSDHCIRIEVSMKRNFHRIWIAMEKPLVKRAPVYSVFIFHHHRNIDALPFLVYSNSLEENEISMSALFGSARKWRPRGPMTLTFIGYTIAQSVKQTADQCLNMALIQWQFGQK